MEETFEVCLTGDELMLVLKALDAVGPPGDMDGQITWMNAREKVQDTVTVVESAGGC